MIHPKFFGDVNQPLYGVLHEPTGSEFKEFAVVCCYAFAKEYLRSHRAVRRLCQNLAAAGVPCLRFDYRGTGDSFGDVFSFEQAKQDLNTAINHILDETGLDTVKLVGMRLGGAIASASLADNATVKDMVLWDPVVDGRQYVAELLEDSDLSTDQLTTEEQPTWISGFSVAPDFLQSLCEYRLDKVELNKCDRLQCIVTGGGEELVQIMNHRGIQTTADRFELLGADNWVHRSRDGNIMMPTKLLKSIQQYLTNDSE